MEVADDDDRDDDDDDIYDSVTIITDIINRVNNNRTIHKLESVDDGVDGCAGAFDGVGVGDCGGGDKNDVYDVDVGWYIFSGFEMEFDIDVVYAVGVYEYMDV